MATMIIYYLAGSRFCIDFAHAHCPWVWLVDNVGDRRDRLIGNEVQPPVLYTALYSSS
jgi:hypothetical protein